MGWETRTTPDGRTHGPYYYGKERGPDGRPRSRYVGTGELACLVADYAETAAGVERAARALLRFDLAPTDAALAAVRAAEDRLRPFVRAYLVATGHRTHRGQWRRRRDVAPADGGQLGGDPSPSPAPANTRPAGADTMARTKAQPKPADPLNDGSGVDAPSIGMLFRVPDGTAPDVCRALGEALSPCRTDDPAAVDVNRLRTAFDRLPASAFYPLADRIALRAAAETAAGAAGIVSVLAEAEAERFAAELAGDGGPLVGAAATHAAHARLVLVTTTAGHARAVRGSYTLSHGEHWEKRLGAAQTRYLRALATVALLRRAEGNDRAVPALAARPAGSVYARLAPPPLDATLAPGTTLAPYSGDGLPVEADVELALA